MQPVEPIEPEERIPSGWYRVVYAKDQPEYLPLPVLKSGTSEGSVVSRWRPTWRERLALVWGADLWLTLWTFHQPLQPIQLSIRRPALLQDLILEPTPPQPPGPPNPPRSKYQPVG